MVANDNLTVRDALELALRRSKWRVAAAVSTYEQLVKAVAAHQPDLVVSSASLGDRPVSPALGEIGRHGAVALLAPPQTDDTTASQLLAGAQGWFDLDSSLESVLDGLRWMAEGWPIITGPGAALVLHEWRTAQREAGRRRPTDVPGLTTREADVLRAMGCGHTTKEIASELGIAAKTVENHKTRIFAKLGARNTAHALALAADRGLLAN